MKPKFLPIIVGIAGILVITSWIFLITPDLKNEPKYFETQMEVRTDTAFAKNVGDPLPEDPRTYLVSVKREIVENNNQISKIKTIISAEDFLTGEIIRNSEEVHDVNRITRQYTDMDGVQFSFPLNSQKQSYDYFSYGREPLRVDYDRTDEINGLETFVYKSSGVYDISGEYPMYPSETLMQNLSVELWVEPTSAHVLSYETYWSINAIRDNQEILVATAHGKTTDYSATMMSEWARQKIELFYLYDTIIPILLASVSAGLVLVVFVNQNLKTRTTELEYSKKEKWEILGKLAANLAHDIRNPLHVIKISTEIIKKTDDKEIKDKQIQKITRGMQRIAHQVDDVLEYVGFSPLKFSNKSIREILISSYNLMSITDNININFPDNDIKIDCDEKRLERLFVNIFLNATQAIGSDKGSIDVRIHDKDDRVEIECENSGPAIDEEILDKIFEPLFTTKMEGTGLGLSSVKSIIESHGGTISVTSPPVIFRIELPKSQ